MILVINLNASVDKRYEMEKLDKGEVMRATTVENTPGGKGIHVANVATILYEECIVTGFLGGKTGEFIEEKIKDYGIKSDFVKIKGDTRECLAIITNDLIRENVIIKVTYEYYTKYKSFISDLIKDGVKFAVIIDDTFDYEESSIIWLNIFTYIITNKDDVTSFDKNKVIFKERM